MRWEDDQIDDQRLSSGKSGSARRGEGADLCSINTVFMMIMIKMLMMAMIMMKKTMSEPNTISAGLSLRRSLEGGGDHWSSQIKDPNKGFPRSQ